jgi:hypothetical protein
MLRIVLSLLATAPTVDREAELNHYLNESCSREDVWRNMWQGMQQTSPCEVLHALEPPPKDFDAAAAELARAWNIPLPAAIPLLDAELFARAHVLDKKKYSDWIASRFAEAITAAPQ